MKLKYLAIIASTLLTAPLAKATDYYVSNSGKDSNKGTKTKPFKTFVHATKKLKAGDRLLLASGHYPELSNPCRGDCRL